MRMKLTRISTSLVDSPYFRPIIHSFLRLPHHELCVAQLVLSRI